MRNQIDAARRLGLRCETINSASATTVTELERQLRADEVDLLLISPERLANPEFGSKIMPIVGARPGLIVIDEVHCISDWGHDFRPDYRRIGRIVDRLAGSSVPILGCTATANDRVVNDVADQLGAELTTFRGPLRREGLALSTIRLDRQAERLAWLADTLPELDGFGHRLLPHRARRRERRRLARVAGHRGRGVLRIARQRVAHRGRAQAADQRDQGTRRHHRPRHGLRQTRPQLRRALPVARLARRVLPAGRPRRPSTRDRAAASCSRGQEDEQIQDWFIEQAFAEEHLVNDIVNAFDSFDGPVPLMAIQVKLNVKIGTLELVVKQLDVDGVLERVAGTSYQRTLAPWTYPASRVEAVTTERRLEQQAMVDYFHTTGCRMRFIANLLDDPAADDCGICDNCTGDTDVRQPSVELAAAAERFLLTRPIEVSPKKMYLDADTGGRKKIPAAEQLADGRALAMWGDAGWGQLVRDGKLTAGRFDDRLVDALAELVADWAPTPAPEWITAVPSTRYPTLVTEFAERLAVRLGLPFHPVLERIAERPTQKEQRNSAHQQANVDGAFAVTSSIVDAPVLLVDDLVDSGWTITEVGRLLRRAGVPLVQPVALSSTF